MKNILSLIGMRLSLEALWEKKFNPCIEYGNKMGVPVSHQKGWVVVQKRRGFFSTLGIHMFLDQNKMKIYPR